MKEALNMELVNQLLNSGTEFLSLWVNMFAALGTVVASWAAIRGLIIQTSPDVIMFVKPDEISPGFARLIVRNIGEAPAYDVRFCLSKDLFEPDSLEYQMASVIFDRGYTILPPKQERDILLGSFQDLESRWGHDVVDVKVSYSKKYRKRKITTVCPVEIGSFESKITLTQETSFERDQKAAYRELKHLGRRLLGIESAVRSLNAKEKSLTREKGSK